MKYIIVLALLFACAPVSVTQLEVTSTPSAIVASTATRAVSGELWKVCGGSVNVRSVPAPRDGVIDWLNTGDTVRVMGWEDGWARLGDGQFVNGKYLCEVSNVGR